MKNVHVVNIKGKTYHNNWIDSQMKRGNIPEVAKYVNPKGAVKIAMKSRLGWMGTGITTTQNARENIANGESKTKIIGDAGVDVGVGAVSLSTGVYVSALIVASGGTALFAAGAGFIAANILTYVIDGIEKDGESASDKIKKGVQKGIKTIAKWFK
ncbi:hypothetical protein ACFFJJ_13225 [Fictibacillus phosphorivorans]